MKRFLLFFVSLAFGTGLFIWTVQRIGWEEIISLLAAVPPVEGFAIFLFTVVALLFGALRWKVILRKQGYQTDFATIWKIYFGGYSFMFFLPMVFFGGELFRTYAVQSKYDIPFQRGLASNVIERILEVTIYMVFIILGVAYLIFSQNAPLSRVIWIPLMIVLALGILLFLFYFFTFRRIRIVRSFLKNLKVSAGSEVEREIFRFFHWKNRALWLALWLSLLKSGTMFIRAWAIVLFLGKTIVPFAVLPILAFQYIALFVPVPASFGSHEILQSVVFEGLNLEPQTGAAFAFLVRAIEIVVALGALVFVIKYGLVMLRSKVAQRLSELFF